MMINQTVFQVMGFYNVSIFPFFFDGSKHSPMAALSSSLDSGVNSVAAYGRDYTVEARVRVLENEGPILP